MNKLIFLFFSFISLNLTAQQDSCHLQFLAEGYHSGNVKLIGVYGDRNFLQDSAFIDANGQFEFKRKSPLKPGYYYLILPDNGNIHFILDEDQHFKMISKKGDLIGSMKVESSVDNTLLYESLVLQIKLDQASDSLNYLTRFDSTNKKKIQQQESLIKKLQDDKKHQLQKFQSEFPNSFFTKYKLAGQNPELIDVYNEQGELDREKQVALFRDAFWDNVDLSDIRLLRTPVIANKLKRFIQDLTPQQPDSIIRQTDIIIKKSLANKEMFQFVSNWIALAYQPTKTKVMDGEAVYVHILENYFTKELGYWLTDVDIKAIQKKVFEMKSSLLNRKGPDVVSTDYYGNTRSIYELKEDYIVIFMYDPDCDHCQKETPELLEFYKEWKSKSVEVFAIVLNATDKLWRDFVVKNKTDVWINVHDPTNKSIYAKYFVDITPEIYVLNKERMIIGKNLKPNQIPVIINQDLERRKKY